MSLKRLVETWQMPEQREKQHLKIGLATGPVVVNYLATLDRLSGSEPLEREH